MIQVNSTPEEADEIVTKLKFEPTEDMCQGKDGIWRYKQKTFDEFGNNISGNFVKGAPSPNPGGRSKFETEVMHFMKRSSMDAAQFLYRTMMNSDQPVKIRVKCAENILDRGLGRAVQQVNVQTGQEMQDLIKPIVISDAVMKRMYAAQADRSSEEDDAEGL